MKILGVIALCVSCFVAGWFLGGSRQREIQVRADRAVDVREEPTPLYTPRAEESDVKAITDPAPAAQREEESVTAEGPEAVQEEQPAQQIAGFLKGAMPLIRIQAKQDARAEALELAELLQLAPHRRKQLAEALEKDALRQLEEGLLPLLDGQEPDLAALANLEERDGMTKALDTDLALILNPNELGRVREYRREKDEEERRQRIEGEVAELAVPDLTEDQERQLREVIRAEVEGDDEVESPSSQAELKEMMSGGLDKDSMVSAVEESYRRRRAKLEAFLTREQLAHLDRRHEDKKKETEAAAGLMGGLFRGLTGSVEVKVGGAPPAAPEPESK